ncbi:uncharacterized protein ASCRUDRAFT_108040 [Ascoidea rubescens DSM 1968]|uniref:Uncharacterized protein n=1 Tax=Ascoidea rubescens DSM 1968 TaxID=1344418 RepID=A0A1D2VEH4_9ASCO|nr:hypothetical protein ASCRUDRAFT_108040 [Ascoidea rubescens DSM 1968]ODV59920.1 hypothetical protein ASCRUDRAFT_108040 [Ascoidea rubescens DSM 1968]
MNTCQFYNSFIIQHYQNQQSYYYHYDIIVQHIHYHNSELTSSNLISLPAKLGNLIPPSVCVVLPGAFSVVITAFYYDLYLALHWPGI